MKWFRVYSEARTDAKLESLTDAQHRVWFRLMCFAGDQDERGLIVGYDEELLAVEVARGDVELLRATLARLVKLRIVSTGDDGDTVQITNWDKRQYARDDGRLPLAEWSVLRSAIFARDNYTCRYCGSYGGRLECDHVIPVSRGGSNEPDNLATACARCNRSKHNKTPTEGSMNVGLRVKCYGADEYGRDVSGMSGTITDLSVFWAHVALTCWSGEVVRVERIRLVPLDPAPKSVAQWRRDREDWADRNRRQLARLRVRAAA